MLRKFIYFSLITFTLTILTPGCINIERNIRINANGSGSEQMIMKFDKEFFDFAVAIVEQFDSAGAGSFRDSIYNDDLFTLDTKENITERDGIRLIDINSVTNSDSSKTMTVTYEFDNITLLTQPIESEALETSSYGYEIEWMDESDHINFKFTIVPKEKEDEDDLIDMNIFEEAFSNNFVVFNIEMPHYILTSNSNEINGKILTWRIKMIDVMELKEPIVLEAVLTK